MDQAQASCMSSETLRQTHPILPSLKNKEEVYIGGKEIMGVYLKRWCLYFSKIQENESLSNK